MECVERSTCMTHFDLASSKAEEGEGQLIGERLTAVMEDNHTITALSLLGDFIRPDNVGKWGDKLMANKNITKLYISLGYNSPRSAILKRTEGRIPKLKYTN